MHHDVVGEQRLGPVRAPAKVVAVQVAVDEDHAAGAGLRRHRHLAAVRPDDPAVPVHHRSHGVAALGERAAEFAADQAGGAGHEDSPQQQDAAALPRPSSRSNGRPPPQPVKTP